MTSLSLQFFRILIFCSCLHFHFFSFRSHRCISSFVSAVQLKRHSEGKIGDISSVSAVQLIKHAESKIGDGSQTGNSAVAAAAEVTELETTLNQLKALRLSWNLQNYKLIAFQECSNWVSDSVISRITHWIKPARGWCEKEWPASPDSTKLNLIDRLEFFNVNTKPQNLYLGINVGPGGSPQKKWGGQMNSPGGADVLKSLTSVKAFVAVFSKSNILKLVTKQRFLVPHFDDDYEKLMCQDGGAGKGSVISPVIVLLMERFFIQLGKYGTFDMNKLTTSSTLPRPQSDNTKVLSSRKTRSKWKEDFESQWTPFYDTLKVAEKEADVKKLIFDLKTEVLGVKELVKMKAKLKKYAKETRDAGYDGLTAAASAVPFVNVIAPAVTFVSNDFMSSWWEHSRMKQKFRENFVEAIGSVLDTSVKWKETEAAEKLIEQERNLKVIGGLMLLLNYWRLCFPEVTATPDTKKNLLKPTTADKGISSNYDEVVKTYEEKEATLKENVKRAVLIHDALQTFLSSVMPNYWNEYAAVLKGAGAAGNIALTGGVWLG